MRLACVLLVACWNQPAPSSLPATPRTAIAPTGWAAPLVRCGSVRAQPSDSEIAVSRDGVVFFDGRANMIKRLAPGSTAAVDIVATESEYSITRLAAGGDRVYWSMMGEYELRTSPVRDGKMQPISLPDHVHSIVGIDDGALVLTITGNLYRVTGDVPTPFVMARKLKHVAVDGQTIYVEDGTSVFRFTFADTTFHEVAKTGGPLHEGDQFTASGGIVAWFTTDKRLHVARPGREVTRIPDGDGLSPRVIDGIVFFTRRLALYRVVDRTIEVAIDDRREHADGMFRSFEVEGSRIVVVHDDGLRMFCPG